MSDPSILKEFLIALGYKVDEAAIKKFSAGVKAATKVAVELGTAMAGAAAAVEVAVVKVSRQFEDLYYASQRIGGSVENVRGFGFALSQMGGTADGARQALENVAEFMRSTPGGEGFIRGLGVQTRDANGQLRDTVEITRDLGAQFRQMPYWAAKVRAAVLGIDDRTLKAMMADTGQFEARFHELAQQMGIDQDQAAGASVAFGRAIRDLQIRVELLVDKIILGLQERAGEALKRFGDIAMQALGAVATLAGRVVEWFGKADKATGGWSTALAVLVAVLGPLLLLLDPVVVGVGLLALGIVALIDDFQTWREGGKSLIDWSQWSDEIDAVMSGLSDLGDAFMDLIRPLAQLAAALVRYLGPAVVHAAIRIIADVLHLLAGTIRVIVDVLEGRWAKAWADSGKWGRDAIKSVVDAMKGAIDIAGAFWDAITGKKHPKPAPPQGPSAKAREDALAHPKGAAAPGAPTAPVAPKSVPMEEPYAPARQVGQAGAAMAKQAMAYFQSQGWSPAAVAGIVANLQRESKLDPHAVGDKGHAFGIGQWHEDRQKAFAKWAGHDIRQSTFMEQLAFVHHELTQGADLMALRAGQMLAKAGSAGEAGDIMSRLYERPFDQLGEATLRANAAADLMGRTRLGANAGPTNVTLNQQTTIQVDGARDPAATGRAVGTEQARVNGDLLRRTKGALS